jgi:cytidylate kinase
MPRALRQPATLRPVEVLPIAGILANAPKEPRKTMFRLDQDMIITIDGPAASGKTATAEELARVLGMQVLSTGAMYRCATAIALEHKIAREHSFRLLEIVRKSHMHFNWHARTDEGRPSPEIIAFGKSYAKRITDEEVTGNVSEYSEVIPLRELMVGMQRDIAKGHRRLITEGRDQGSVVFPDADVKFYLWASPRVRAIRRRQQLIAKKGIERDLDELEREIASRDENDRRKPYGALVQPADALSINSDDLDLAQVVSHMRDHVLAKARAS